MNVGDKVTFVAWDRNKRSHDELEALKILQLTTGVIQRLEANRLIISWNSNVYKLDFGDFQVENTGQGFLAEMFSSEVVVGSFGTTLSDQLSKTTTPLQQLLKKADRCQEEAPLTPPLTLTPLEPPATETPQQHWLRIKGLSFVKGVGFIALDRGRIPYSESSSRYFQYTKNDVLPNDVVKNSFKRWTIQRHLYDRLAVLIKSNQTLGSLERNFATDVFEAFIKWQENWTDKQCQSVAKMVYKYQNDIKKLQGENYKPITDSYGLFSDEYLDKD